MKLHSKIKLNGKTLDAGAQVPWLVIYPFFLVHMLAFGGSGFFMAYSTDPPPLLFLYIHGGIAIFVYTMFYFALFGVDEVKWMVLNAGLGILGIIAQLDWILALFDRDFDDYSWARHAIPFTYYVLYTFLLRQAIIDLAGVREDEERRRWIDNIYVFASLAIYLWMIF